MGKKIMGELSLKLDVLSTGIMYPYDLKKKLNKTRWTFSN